MIPKPVYCKNCGGFTGKCENVYDDEIPDLGEHEHLGDCIQELHGVIMQLNEELKNVKQEARNKSNE